MLYILWHSFEVQKYLIQIIVKPVYLLHHTTHEGRWTQSFMMSLETTSAPKLRAMRRSSCPKRRSSPWYVYLRQNKWHRLRAEKSFRPIVMKTRPTCWLSLSLSLSLVTTLVCAFAMSNISSLHLCVYIFVTLQLCGCIRVLWEENRDGIWGRVDSPSSLSPYIPLTLIQDTRGGEEEAEGMMVVRDDLSASNQAIILHEVWLGWHLPVKKGLIY